MSKSTPRGAVAKFAAGGKPVAKKDLAMMAVNYGSVYVARIAMGSSDMQTVKAFLEAEAWNGPSIIIAYSHCIAHGYDLVHGLDQQKLAVQAGHWPLFRYNPKLALEGKNPFVLDSKQVYYVCRWQHRLQIVRDGYAELLEGARHQSARADEGDPRTELEEGENVGTRDPAEKDVADNSDM